MKLAELPEVMTIEQVADYLHVGRSTAYDAARRGELPVVRLGRRLLVPRARLEGLLGLTDRDEPGNTNGAGSPPAPFKDPKEVELHARFDRHRTTGTTG
jgi:excisionase family DNA binding protein